MSDSKKFDFNKIKHHARDLRNNSTEFEKKLWEEIRGRKLSGYKFLRQHPLLYKGNLMRFNYLIADFYCDRKKAVIELDGPIHISTEVYDDFRDKEMEEPGLHILRIKNEELQNMENVLNKIKTFLNHIPDFK